MTADDRSEPDSSRSSQRDSAVDYIHGGTDAREIARLERQAEFVAPWSLAGLDVAPGMRVLDLGTGIGAMAAKLVERFPGIELVGLDRSPEQLAVARARGLRAEWVQGDATALPFPDESFDRVHATWLLEHVPDPEAVLREVRRVLRPRGSCWFVEVDNATLRTEPRIEVVEEVMAALDRAQLAAGGDPYVGRKLAALFRKSGFLEVRVRPLPLVGDASDPMFFRGFVEEFAEIFESVEEALGPAMLARIRDAAARLRGLPHTPGSAIHYAPTLGCASR